MVSVTHSSHFDIFQPPIVNLCIKGKFFNFNFGGDFDCFFRFEIATSLPKLHEIKQFDLTPVRWLVCLLTFRQFWVFIFQKFSIF